MPAETFYGLLGTGGWRRAYGTYVMPVTSSASHAMTMSQIKRCAVGSNTTSPLMNLTAVKNRKLKRFGHVTRSCGLAKTVPQGTVEGKRKRGRQRKRWTVKAEEWTGNSGGEEKERQTEETKDRQ